MGPHAAASPLALCVPSATFARYGWGTKPTRAPTNTRGVRRQGRQQRLGRSLVAIDEVKRPRFERSTFWPPPTMMKVPKYRLTYTDGDDGGDFTTAAPDWKIGDTFRTGGGASRFL